MHLDLPPTCKISSPFISYVGIGRSTDENCSSPCTKTVNQAVEDVPLVR